MLDLHQLANLSFARRACAICGLNFRGESADLSTGNELMRTHITGIRFSS